MLDGFACSQRIEAIHNDHRAQSPSPITQSQSQPQPSIHSPPSLPQSCSRQACKPSRSQHPPKPPSSYKNKLTNSVNNSITGKLVNDFIGTKHNQILALFILIGLLLIVVVEPSEQGSLRSSSSQPSSRSLLSTSSSSSSAKSILLTIPKAKPSTSRNFSKRNEAANNNNNNPHNEGCADLHEYSKPRVFGVRCDDESSIIESDGSIVIKDETPTDVYLIGQNLDQDFKVALTPMDAVALEDCTHFDRVKTMDVTKVSSSIGKITIKLPSPGDWMPYYLCLRPTSGGGATSYWYHQGSDSWLRIHIHKDLLPLPMKLAVIAGLLMLSGLFSGLNLGLMALDKNELQVIISCGSETEKRYARAIEPVRRRGNYLLCSILFSNVLVNSTIAVLLEELTSGIVAVMTSTIFIVMFGEILPQSFCSRHGLAVGAKTVSITYLCMVLTFPLSYPVSFCLDWALGEEIGHAYDRERLMEFIKVTRDYNNLETDEVNIISGALKLKRIQLSEVMTRIEDVYMLDIMQCLDFDTIDSIIQKGYSRIPVHEANNKKNIVALLFAKDLALLDPDDRTPIKTIISIYNHPIMKLFEDTTLDTALNMFKTGKSHMAFVQRIIDDGDRDPIYEITGIVTLEDVIEEIMQMEINDETDTLTDNRRKRRRKEAQIRKDFSQFAHLGAGDSSHNVVTPQLRLAAFQYLATNIEPFTSSYISESVLERLMSQKIYFKVRVDEKSQQNHLQHQHEQQQLLMQNHKDGSMMTEGADQDQQQSSFRGDPNEHILYRAGEPADYFIMILEGRISVTCGREKLVFEGGPFSYFGVAALAGGAAAGAISQPSLQDKRLQPPPPPTSIDRRESKLSTFKSKLSTPTAPPQPPPLPPTSDSNPSQVSDSVSNLMEMYNMSAGGSSNLATSRTQLKSSESRVSVHSLANLSTQSSPFVPDYTVECTSSTSYLKITRSNYISAIRATLAGDQLEPVNGDI